MSGTHSEKADAEICRVLVAHYFDVLEGVRVAFERLESEADGELAGKLRADHERAARLFSELCFEHGTEPPMAGDIKRVLTEGRVALAEIAGDRGLLGALKANEKGLCVALEHARERAAPFPALRTHIEEELAVAVQHARELDERLRDLRDSAHVLS